MEITTIKLQKNTKIRLDKLKLHKRQSYDEAIQHILEIMNICKVNPEKARSKLAEIDRINRSFNDKLKRYS